MQQRRHGQERGGLGRGRSSPRPGVRRRPWPGELVGLNIPVALSVCLKEPKCFSLITSEF